MSNLPFGVDISRWDSAEHLMDFKVAAQHEEPIRYIGIRAGISWGYQDPFFVYHMEETIKMHDYRKMFMPNKPADYYIPVGRMPYHVIYPGESVQRQTDNFFRITDPIADYNHDRLVIDAELDHGQTRQRVTLAINDFARICKNRTGRLPILYSRRQWLMTYAVVADLNPDLDLWLAQYLFKNPLSAYANERPSPPELIAGRGWLIHQTGDRMKPIGVKGKQYMDYNRWNGTDDAVFAYFNFDKPITKPIATLEERVMALEVDYAALDKRVAKLEVGK
jgi:GH25 family lysozyme M1 (1,4-beta-N-acetylmuramidase)